MRKLLPYEIALIEALSITEEEYFDFRKAQQEYKDPKVGTIFDIRNEAGTVALVLTVVGILFQVGAALLAPRPNAPSVPDIENAPQARSKRFAPRYGFESFQDVAKYGDPVNLVYTSQTINPRGGIRVNTSLLWSAVYSVGRNQYIQLLATIGAGPIGGLNVTKTAFGQTIVDPYFNSSAWLYFLNASKNNAYILPNLQIISGDDRFIRFRNLAVGTGEDPFYSGSTQLTFAATKDGVGKKFGFSQAFSPSSASELGVTDPIAINIDVVERDEDGEEVQSNNYVTLVAGFSSFSGSQGPIIPKDAVMPVKFARIDDPGSNIAAERAKELRMADYESIELGAIYKYGSAKFQVVNIGALVPDLRESSATVSFKCIEEGYGSSVAYNQRGGVALRESGNDGLKCLAKIAEAYYDCVSPSVIVNFALRAKAFMFVQGRAPRYVEAKESKYNYSDNGYKQRTVMFLAKYREKGSKIWITAPSIFCISRASDNDTFIPLSFNSTSGAKVWEFMFEPVIDPQQESRKFGSTLSFVYLTSSGSLQTAGSVWSYKGYERSAASNSLPPNNIEAYGINEWMLYSARSDTDIRFSFESGNEIGIVAVSEQQEEAESSFGELYDGMCLVGLTAFSTQSFRSLRNFSVFVSEGRKMRLLNETNGDYLSTSLSSSCYAPDIFLDTAFDDLNGIGRFVKQDSIDFQKLALAKRFCIKNQYFMDCVIAQPQSWRQFWSEVAPFSLLELAKIGGKETLVPAVPVTNDGTITNTIIPTALFNQGNILEGSYKEEFIDYGEATQDLIATIIYRDQGAGDNSSAFAKNSSLTVSLKDTLEADASRRTFDLSDYVTSYNQALNYGMLLVNQRRHIKRTIEFQTFPVDAPVQPGDYVLVQLDENQWDNIRSGSVLKDGTIVMPFGEDTSLSNTTDALVYQPGNAPFVVNASLVGNYRNSLFVIGTASSAARMFRVASVSIGEEGEVTISAIEHPCYKYTSGGTTRFKSYIVNFSSGNYTIS